MSVGWCSSYSVAFPSSNTPPVGPPGGNRTPHRTLAAPCSTERGALGPPISVRTHPGLIAFTRIPRGLSSFANKRAIALSAALLAP
jgi:hypothetical protein